MRRVRRDCQISMKNLITLWLQTVVKFGLEQQTKLLRAKSDRLGNASPSAHFKIHFVL